jgi:hypothetical protein
VHVSKNSTGDGFGPDLVEVFGPSQSDGGPELVQLLTPEGERVHHPDFDRDFSAEELVGFYRDGIGLPELGRFEGHDGYDGVFLDLPGTGAHLELTRGGAEGAPAPHPESLLVLYLGSQEAVEAALTRTGARPVDPANPYWAANGVTIADPDDFRIVLVSRSWDG